MAKDSTCIKASVWTVMRYSVSRWVKEIREGGVSEVYQKAFRLFGSLLALVPVLLIRCLRPFVLVRFSNLQSERIGHFAANTELYLCHRDTGLLGRKSIDLFYHSKPICNQQLKKMWERVLTIHWFVGRMDTINRWLPGGSAHLVQWPVEK